MSRRKLTPLPFTVSAMITTGTSRRSSTRLLSSRAASSAAKVVSVGGDHVKAEGAQLGVERLERHHLLGAAERLDAISIDQPDDVGQPAMGDE